MKISLNFKDVFYQELIKEGVYDPAIFKAIFMAGGPGSGKSYVADRTTKGLGYRIVNSDKAFEMMLKKVNIGGKGTKLDAMDDEEMAQAQDIRTNRATPLTGKIQQKYIDGRLGMIIDGTGADYQRIVKQVNELRELGYDTYMIFVNTSLDVAQERNRNRKRSLPPDIVEDSWRSVQNNMGRFQGLFGASNFVIVDNENAGEDVFKKVWKYVMNFTKKKVKNPIAKKWMDMELAKKRRD